MARVAIVGVGAIGGVIAGLLQTAGGHEITLCTRSPLPQLTVETPEGVIAVSGPSTTAPQVATPQDWVIAATKTYSVAEAAAKWLPSICDLSTRVAVVQNGVEHRENFADWLPPERIVPVVIDVPAERRPHAGVLQRGPATMKVERTPAGAAFAELFTGSRAQIELTDDFLTAAWRKLCINAAGVISALTLKPAGVLRDEALGQVALDLIAECVAVGRAQGAKLEDGIPERVLAGYRAGSPESVNSLLADRLAGRATEIDARNGVIVRLGELHGVPTPTNRMALALFKALA